MKKKKKSKSLGRLLGYYPFSVALGHDTSNCILTQGRGGGPGRNYMGHDTVDCAAIMLAEAHDTPGRAHARGLASEGVTIQKLYRG